MADESGKDSPGGSQPELALDAVIAKLLECMKSSGWDFHMISIIHRETNMVVEIPASLLRDSAALEGLLLTYLPPLLSKMSMASKRRRN